MTEAEWQESIDSREMLRWLGSGWSRRLSTWFGLHCPFKSRRKAHLFVAGCCVRSTDGIPHPGDAELMANVDFGWGRISHEEFETRLHQFANGRRATVAVEAWAADWALAAARGKAWGNQVLTNFERGWDDYNKIRDEELRAQCDLLRDIFGNPFRPVVIEPAWLAWNDGTIPKLAQVIYEERELPSGHFDRGQLAILADALEEAGCGDAELLGHLRGEGPHVRGCHVLDALLQRPS